MSKLFNRAKMTTTTAGTGNLTLGSAADGFVTFAAAGVVNGDVVRYCIEAENGTDFEIGEGSYTASGTVLSRADADVQLSSNSNNRITLAAGTHNVFITAADSDFTQEITVTVAGGKFVIDGTSQQIITLLPSITYRLDQSDSTNASHPLVLASGSADGSTYSTGVRTVGTPGSKGAYTEVKLEQDAPALWYKCSSHSSMGNSVNLAAPTSGAASAVGTLTKTFTQNEESTITLSSAISPVPNVSVFKEVAQAGLSSKGNWDVNSTASNYTRLDEATAVTLTPSAVGSGTFSLGSGSFAAADIGKTITGNGGVAVLTSAAGAYTTSTNFTNTNAIASGSWDMHGSVPKSDGSGLTVSGFSSSYNIAGASSDSLNKNVSGQLSSISGVDFSPNGLWMYVCASNNTRVYTYPLSSAFNVSTAGSSNFASNASMSGPVSVRVSKTNGGRLFVLDSDTKIYQWDLPTAYVGYSVNNAAVSSSLGSGTYKGMDISPDGTMLFVLVGSQVNRYNLQYPNYTQSAASYYHSNYSHSFILGSATEIYFAHDGYSFFALRGAYINSFKMTTAWDITTASTDQFYTHSGTSGSSATGIAFANTGQKMYIADGSSTIYQFTTGAVSHSTSQYFPSVTGASGQINTSPWTDINSMTADETAGNGTLSYAISTDNHVTWKVIHNTSGTRSIAKNNSGTWQVNTNATYGSETWANATTNTELGALQQALATANNRMNKTQLDAVSDANHITLGNTLDLMIAPYIASGATAPLSDGVTINYDGAALVKKAINGTDYEAEFPSSTSVKIKSLAAQNLKVRVL